MYIVIALYDTDQGQAERCIFITEGRDIGKAVEAARQVEKLSYTFSKPGACVSILSIPLDIMIHASGKNLVFVRRRTSEGWTEEWFDKLAQRAALNADMMRRLHKFGA
ncbi:MAG: hypothetical protein QOG91_330 [Candidatus Parcubacteria bacterium]|jgi:hypothetical protein|nr:hypothetical protein [Candidatus Parcubacteria bacterium]